MLPTYNGNVTYLHSRGILLSKKQDISSYYNMESSFANIPHGFLIYIFITYIYISKFSRFIAASFWRINYVTNTTYSSIKSTIRIIYVIGIKSHHIIANKLRVYISLNYLKII